MTIQDAPSIRGVCALSPVISYKSVHGINTLADHLKSSGAGKYVFDQQSMSAFTSGQIISPEKQLQLPANKIVVLGGLDDTEIPIQIISQFCTNHNIKLHFELTGHITFSKIDQGMYQKIAEFFAMQISAE